MNKPLKTSFILDADGKAFTRVMTEAEMALEGVQKTAKTAGAVLDSNSKKTKRGLESISQQLARTKTQVYGFFGFSAVKAQIKSLVGSLSGVAQATDRWQSRLTVATGSLAAANKEIEWVRKNAKKLSLDFRSSAEGFSSFATAANLAGIQMDDVKKTFMGVSHAAVAMKLSGEQQSRALLALSQMASKGVVSMEELPVSLVLTIQAAVNFVIYVPHNILG